MALSSDEVAHAAVDIASDKLAENIVMLDIRGMTLFADYFVIMSAGSARQVSALQEDLEKGMKDVGVPLHHREGSPASGWVLLDFSDVIVHIFGEEEAGALPVGPAVVGSATGGHYSIIHGSIERL